MENRESCCVDNFVDDYAMARIRYRVGKIARRFGMSSHERADLQQDMAAELLKASARFDPSLASRRTFINRVLDRHMKYLLRKEYTRRCRPCTSPAGFDDINHGFQPAVNDLRMGELDEQARAEVRLDLEAVIATMPAKLQSVCAALTELKPADAAERLGVSRQTVYRYIHEIREHFERAGLTPPSAGGTDWPRLQM